VYGVTRAADADEARTAAQRALDAADCTGTVRTAAPRNAGARLSEE
jgi:predicted sugar kinase